jgi:23S rRNA (cytosine1962-C5)-methyltransferase
VVVDPAVLFEEKSVLEQRGVAPDHPVSATCLETDYLKCMICEVQ